MFLVVKHGQDVSVAGGIRGSVRENNPALSSFEGAGNDNGPGVWASRLFGRRLRACRLPKMAQHARETGTQPGPQAKAPVRHARFEGVVQTGDPRRGVRRRRH
jgi:hypothetical protein